MTMCAADHDTISSVSKRGIDILGYGALRSQFFIRNKRIVFTAFRNSICILGLLSYGAWSAAAQQFAPYEEIRKRSEIFDLRPSFDTKPVAIKVGSVTYHIPRNYLMLLPPALPTLRVTYPGLKPLTGETRNCLGSRARAERAGCASIEFALSDGTSPGGRRLTHAEMLQNFLRNLKGVKRGKVLDYDVYEIGPDNARTEIYRNVEHDLFFDCFINLKINRQENCVCSDQFTLSDNNYAHFFFRRSQIGGVADIEANIRRLVATFANKEGR